MLNSKYKPKSQKYYVYICEPNMLGKKNSSTQFKYKKKIV